MAEQKVCWWVQPVTIAAGRRYFLRWTATGETSLTEAEEDDILYDKLKKAQEAGLERFGESICES